MPRRHDPHARLWAEACEQIDRAGGLQRQFFRLAATLHAPAVWEPPVDVFEDEHEVVVVVAMPGVAPEQLEVRTDNGQLVLRGLRQWPLSGSGHVVRQLEIPYGAFERRIPLPPGPLQLGAPELVRGCLVLRLGKLGGGGR